jgi:glycoside/pentoside/hexuronide:cation symporter, GPH family
MTKQPHDHTIERLPLGRQIAYAIGQFGWSTLVNIVGLMLVYFYVPPDSAGLPFLITQVVFWEF